jgi:hypothetical protein
MRILLTNNTLHWRSGSELYIYDVAVELLNRGHEPVAFSTVLGNVAELLRAATVPVVDDLSRLAAPPDVIHGHHHFDTLIAALTFPATPVLNFCHGWLPWEEQPLIFPSVIGYVAVDHVCRDRLILEHGIPPERVQVLLNFVDTNRFRSRSRLPAEPKRALAFGNLFQNDGSLAILEAACREAGIELDATGFGTGRTLPNPETEIGLYDLVFAKSRAALEAMAVGTAVILCGPRGLGPMVTPKEWDRLRPLNFGVRALKLPMDVASVLSQIRRYDPAGVADISERVRREATLTGAVDQLIHLYEGVLQRSQQHCFEPALGQLAAAQYLRSHALTLKGRAADVLVAVAAQEQESENMLARAENARVQVENLLAQEKNARANAETAWAQVEIERVQVGDLLAQEKNARANAETAQAHVENERVQVENSLARERNARANAEAALVQANAALVHANNNLAHVKCELVELRNSATWRLARSMMQNPLLRFLRPIMVWMGSRIRGKAAS